MIKERIIIPNDTDIEYFMDSLGCKHVQGGDYVTDADYELIREEDGTRVIISPPQKKNIGIFIGHWWNLFWRRSKIIKKEIKSGMYITIDLETGGLWNDVSLLTAYFGILDKDFNLIDELDLKLIPDDGIYKVEPDGMAVNKINLIDLAKEAITYKEAKTILYNFIKKHFEYINEKSEDTIFLTPIGQGVMADIRKLCETIISKGSWDSFISRRPLDTMYIARYLQQVGKLPKDMTIRLCDLVDYFKVRDKIKGNQHEAKFDALSTVEVLKEMLKL